MARIRADFSAYAGSAQRITLLSEMEDCRENDLKEFPGADVVRLHSDRWSEQHERVMQRLVSAASALASRCNGLGLPAIKHRFESEDPRVIIGSQHAYLLYGREPVFVQDGVLNMDIRGIVYRPRIQRSRRRVTVELP